MMNKTKRTRKRIIPVPIYIISMVLILFLLTFGIYFGIEISKARLNPLLQSKFNYENTPTMIQAKSSGNDGYYSSTIKNLKYSYTDKVDGLKVGLACIEYSDKVNDTNGIISYYVGFQKTNDAELTINSAKIVAAEKWTQFVSSTSSISSSAYTDSKLKDKNKFNLYKNTSTISITTNFPQTKLLGIKRIKHPNIYLYLDYKYGKEDKEVIIEFTFNQYYIDGQSIIKA